MTAPSYDERPSISIEDLNLAIADLLSVVDDQAAAAGEQNSRFLRSMPEGLLNSPHLAPDEREFLVVMAGAIGWAVLNPIDARRAEQRIGELVAKHEAGARQ